MPSQLGATCVPALNAKFSVPRIRLKPAVRTDAGSLPPGYRQAARGLVPWAQRVKACLPIARSQNPMKSPLLRVLRLFEAIPR